MSAQGSRLCGNSQPSPSDDESSLLEFFSESKSLCRGRYAEFVAMEESSAPVFTQPRPIAAVGQDGGEGGVPAHVRKEGHFYSYQRTVLDGWRLPFASR